MELEILNSKKEKNSKGNTIDRLSKQKTLDIIHKYQNSFTCLDDVSGFSERQDIDKKTKDEVLNTYPNEKYHKFFGDSNDLLGFFYMGIDQNKKNEVFNSFPNAKYHNLMTELFHHLLVFGANIGDEFFYGITSSGVNLEEKRKTDLLNSFTIENYCDYINSFESIQYFSMLNIPNQKKNEIINSISNEKIHEFITDHHCLETFDILDIDPKKKQEVINSISNERYNQLYYRVDQIDSLLGLSLDEKKKTDIVYNFINSKTPQIGHSKILSELLDVLSLPRMADIKLNIDVMEKIKPDVQKKIAEAINRNGGKSETEVIKFIQDIENRQCNNNYKPVDFYKWIFNLTQESLSNENDGIKLSTEEKLSIVKGLSNIHSMDLKKAMSNEFSSIMKEPNQQIQWKYLYDKFLIKDSENKSPSDSSISLSLLLSKHFYAGKDVSNDTKYFEKFFNLINGRYIRTYGGKRF